MFKITPCYIKQFFTGTGISSVPIPNGMVQHDTCVCDIIIQQNKKFDYNKYL